ncbi:hypothetical protein [Reinekea sp.]|nr:hypothetical protein [Reinekea sp.]
MEDLHSQLNQRTTINNSPVSFSTSIGVAKSPEQAASLRILKQHHDPA